MLTCNFARFHLSNVAEDYSVIIQARLFSADKFEIFPNDSIRVAGNLKISSSSR